MSYRNNKNGKILNILLGIIALFVIIFIISWIVSRGNKPNYDEVFKTNLETMQEEAKKYFANELPEEIGDTTVITLDEMYELDLIDELTYGKEDCEDDDSYISITKVNATEYKVKSHLVCGSKIDSVTEKIKTQTIVDDENGNTIVDDEKDDVDLEVNQGTSSDGNHEDTTVNCFGPVCSFNQIETTCQTTYEYEYVKRQVSCPAGYNLVNGTCVRSITTTVDPTPNYSNEQVIIEDALINKGDSYNRYTDPIVTGGETTYYCKEGTLKDNKCYVYANKETETTYSCPSGYTKSGNKCFKYADLITEQTAKYTCPDGYTKTGSGSNTKCLKVVSAVFQYTKWGNPSKTYSTSTKEATYEKEYEKKILVGENTIGVTKVYTYEIYKRSSYYYCTMGTLDGNKCNVYTNPSITGTVNSYCPSGYTKDGNSCYIKKDLTANTKSYCPDGYTDNGSNCVKSSKALTSTSAKVYTCPSGYKTSGTGANITCYKTYYNEDTYYCEKANATLKGTKCYTKVDKEFIGNTCPSGYTLNNNVCIKTTTETTNPIWTNTEFIYSTQNYLEGYQKTGVAKFITTCTRVENKIYK